MPRPLRLQAPGPYHVFARSVSSRPLFPDSYARRSFLRLVGVTADRHAWHVLAYCVMTTHYHLLVRIEESNLARGMQWLNGVYGASLNAIERDSGHVFGARYGSSPVTTDAYFLQVIRYIALNPVRAGVCADPADWPWSSYRLVVRRLPTPSFLDVDSLLEVFGRDRDTARRRLESFVSDGIAVPAAVA
ncbi:MAG: transposase [Gaiellaceae bacterium]|jgi:putative transposase